MSFLQLPWQLAERANYHYGHSPEEFLGLSIKNSRPREDFQNPRLARLHHPDAGFSKGVVCMDSGRTFFKEQGRIYIRYEYAWLIDSV